MRFRFIIFFLNSTNLDLFLTRYNGAIQKSIVFFVLRNISREKNSLSKFNQYSSTRVWETIFLRKSLKKHTLITKKKLRKEEPQELRHVRKKMYGMKYKFRSFLVFSCLFVIIFFIVACCSAPNDFDYFPQIKSRGISVSSRWLLDDYL